jgi:hypothetical protein
MPAAARIDAVGTTKPLVVHPRWVILHLASGLEHATKARAQYAHAALALAIEEGFGARLLAAGFDFPTMSGCEFAEVIEDEEAARVGATLGARA